MRIRIRNLRERIPGKWQELIEEAEDYYNQHADTVLSKSEKCDPEALRYIFAMMAYYMELLNLISKAERERALSLDEGNEIRRRIDKKRDKVREAAIENFRECLKK